MKNGELIAPFKEEDMISKNSKITFNKSGAGKGYNSGRVTIPKDFLQALEITEDERNIEIELKTEKEIIIRKI